MSTTLPRHIRTTDVLVMIPSAPTTRFCSHRHYWWSVLHSCSDSILSANK